MTNGIVSAEKGGAAGRALTVTYDGGSKRFQITVPPNAPSCATCWPIGQQSQSALP